MWQCQKCGQKHIRRVHAKQCKCKKWCTMCSKLVNNVNKHILLSITEGGHGGYRCGTEACTKVFRRAANLETACQGMQAGSLLQRGLQGQQHGSHATRPGYWFRLFAILNNFPYLKFPRAKFPRHIRKIPHSFSPSQISPYQISPYLQFLKKYI